jgi:hypothetical protein
MIKMNINEVLDQIGSDVLTTEAKQLLADAFTDAVEKTVKERSELNAQSALQSLDESHALQLEQLLSAIDQDHTSKLTAVLSKIDEDHSEKLNYLVKKYERIVKEDATEFKAQLVKQLSNYLDLYLENAVPKQEIMEAVSNKQAQKTLNEIKQLIAIDEDFISDTIREAVTDGKQQIETLKTELNEAVKQNIRIIQEAKIVKSDLLIEQSVNGFSKAKKAHCVKMLKGKDPDYIVENFTFVADMFDKAESSETEVLAESGKKSARTIVEKVDTPKADKTDASLLNEQAPAVAGSTFDYLGALQKQDGKK